MFIRASVVLSISAVVIFQVGCTSHHVPKPGAVEFSGLPRTGNQLRVKIVNDQNNSTEITVGRYAAGTLVGDLRTWTGSAVELAKGALEKQGVTVSDRSSKLLKFAITDAKVDAAGVEFLASLARCKISLKVETGDGYSQTYDETNKALNPPWACDGAMTSVVRSLLQDKNILDYLTK
jgi:hypothetical protein